MQELKDAHDPLKIFRADTTGVLDPSDLDRIDEESERTVDEAVAYARAAAWPQAWEVSTDVYATY